MQLKTSFEKVLQSKTFFLFFIFISVKAFSQYANNWYFGQSAGINFNNNPPTALTNGNGANVDNSSTISDANGNLLFYTDGATVWNSQHSVMQNGSGLTGDFSAGQCALIIPIPCSNKKYVIFHTTNYVNPGHLHYTVVDMTLNGGLGAVVAGQKNVSLGTGWTEKMCAYYNSSNNSYWLVSTKWSSNAFVALEISANSIATNSVVSNIGSIHNCGTFGGLHDAMGQLTISPDGTKIVNALTCQDKYEIFNFNSATGVVSNSISIPGFSGSAWGTAFSPNSQKLYCNSLYGGNIYQYDVSNFTYSAVVSSSVNVYNTGQGGYNFGYMELAPNGRIHVPRANTNFHATINTPNLTAPACNFSFTGQSVAPSTALWGCSRIAYNIPLPFSLSSNVVNSSCSGSSATVTPSAAGAYTYSWSPGNYTSATVNNLAPGSYTVVATNAACNSASAVITVTATAPLSVMISPSLTICRGQSAALSTTVSGGTPAYNYNWSNGGVTSSVAVTPSVTTGYTVTITDANNCNQTAITTVSVYLCDGLATQQMAEQAIKIYPNPFSTRLRIEYDGPLKEVIVTNILGVKIKATVSPQGEIDLSELADGIYFLIIRTDRGQYSFPIIKDNQQE